MLVEGWSQTLVEGWRCGFLCGQSAMFSVLLALIGSLTCTSSEAH